MRTPKTPLLIGLAVVLLVSMACSLTTANTPQATLDPASFQATLNAAATQALATIHAQFTQTQKAIPTEPFVPVASATSLPVQEVSVTATTTPTSTNSFTLPSRTPLPSFTPIPSFTPVVVATETLTPTPTKYDCAVDSMDPAFGSQLTHGDDFDLKLRLKNTGTDKWTSDSFDLKYVSGDKFQKYADAIDMGNDVSAGEILHFYRGYAGLQQCRYLQGHLGAGAGQHPGMHFPDPIHGRQIDLTFNFSARKVRNPKLMCLRGLRPRKHIEFGNSLTWV